MREAAVTLFGVGHIPIASATWASGFVTLAYVPLRLGIRAAGLSPLLADCIVLVIVALGCLLAVKLGPWAIERFLRKDPKQFVLDELAGQGLALLLLPFPVDAGVAGLAAVLSGQFLLFRFFDILKPPPARQLEQLPMGWGILCDDLMAGVYANVAGQIVWRLTPLAAWLGLAVT